MYLITGGGGFLGRSLALRLAAGGGERVRIFDVRENEPVSDGVEYFRGDVTRIDDVEAAFQGVTAVFNLVALLPCSRAGKEFYRVNVDGTKNILKTCAKAGIGTVVHISSSVVYGCRQKFR